MKKREDFENGQNWSKGWAIAHAKMVSWGKKKCQKGANNDCKTTLELLCAKNRFRKGLICEKREPFENGQNWPKAWVIAHAKWSVWVKMRKRCEKKLYEHIGVVVCKKPRQKTPHSKITRAF